MTKNHGLDCTNLSNLVPSFQELLSNVTFLVTDPMIPDKASFFQLSKGLFPSFFTNGKSGKLQHAQDYFRFQSSCPERTSRNIPHIGLWKLN